MPTYTMEKLAPGVSEMIDEAIVRCKIPLAPMPKFVSDGSSSSADGSLHGGYHFAPLAAKEDASAAVRIALDVRARRESKQLDDWMNWFLEQCD